MAGKKYDWQVGHTPPHSTNTAPQNMQVFRSYVQRYIEILTSDPRHDGLNLTLVDGFAGGGEYSYRGQTCPGSPLSSSTKWQARRRCSQRPGQNLLRPPRIHLRRGASNRIWNICETSSGARRTLPDRLPHSLLRERFEAALPDVIRLIQQHGRWPSRLVFFSTIRLRRRFTTSNQKQS